MSLTGGYSSLAEAVGEAPPQTGITGDEYAEILHDCGGDYEEAREALEAIDASQQRDYHGWYRDHGYATHEEHERACRQRDAYAAALADAGIELPDAGT